MLSGDEAAPVEAVVVGEPVGSEAQLLEPALRERTGLNNLSLKCVGW